MKIDEDRYDELVKRYLKEHKIKHVDVLPNLVRVDIVPSRDGWSVCTFIFTERHIACFGDVEAYTWQTTWNAAEAIKEGNCNAKDFRYLLGKLEHKAELAEFIFSDAAMDEIKKRIIEGYDYKDELLDDFNKAWDENYYLLYNVDEHRIEGLDRFFEELDIFDAYEYYDEFEHLPSHYYCAVAMLRCIEEYFKKESEKDGKVLQD